MAHQEPSQMAHQEPSQMAHQEPSQMAHQEHCDGSWYMDVVETDHQSTAEPNMELDEEQDTVADMLPAVSSELQNVADEDDVADEDTPAPDLAGFKAEVMAGVQHDKLVSDLKQKYQQLLMEKIRGSQTGSAFFRTGHEIFNKYLESQPYHWKTGDDVTWINAHPHMVSVVPHSFRLWYIVHVIRRRHILLRQL